MKQVLFLIFLVGLKTFSQSIDLGDIGMLKNIQVDKKNKELYVFHDEDSLSIIDLVGLKVKSKTKISYPQEDFSLRWETCYINSQVHFISGSGGTVYRLEGDKIVRIDRSFDHKMQINSTIFTDQDTIYRYGGYGFWSHRNFFTYYNKTTKDWKLVPPSGSTSLPAGSQSSIITIVNDNIYVYGGLSLDEFNPLNYIKNKEVWKFNKRSKSWDHMGALGAQLTDLKYSIPYKNKQIFLDGGDRVYLVDIENNQLKTFKRTPLQEKIIAFLDSFYLDGIFYCIIREVDTENNIQLITINEDLFLSEMMNEETIYINNEKTYYAVGLILLMVSSIPVYKKIKKETQNRNKIILEKEHVIFKKRILPFDEIRVSLLTLLLTSTEEVSLNDIIDLFDNKELNYGHNTRTINRTIEEINFLLKSMLETKEDLITFKKSDLDKRIKVYSINKSYFLIK